MPSIQVASFKYIKTLLQENDIVPDYIIYTKKGHFSAAIMYFVLACHKTFLNFAGDPKKASISDSSVPVFCNTDLLSVAVFELRSIFAQWRKPSYVISI
mmetsp:Transcript_5540/g.8159  ORF Transcript_5540/g.8159 Transcript_5540/m.8159 type:complete len:99 (-) Transcript_5540:109-405(-)